MQKLIAKYALAAHLAIAAVAPLYLSRFVGDDCVATVILWLSGFAAIWMFLSPSVIGGERVRDSRRRVLRGFLSDPLMWVMALVVAFAAIRAFNGGIKMAYDAENTVWSIAPATFPLLPGTVDGCGYLPFATTVLATLLMAACRHALGKAGRLSFFLMVSFLAGVMALIELVGGFAPSRTEIPGFAYGIYFLVGTVALAGAFEYRWNWTMLLFTVAIGGTGAGLFAFSDPMIVVSFLAAQLVLIGYVFFYINRTLRKAAEFKLLVVYGLSVTVGVFAVLSLVPPEMAAEKVAAIMSWKLFPENFFEVRSALSDIALRAWKVHPWLGSGLSSFSLDVRFFATDADWQVLLSERASALNGYWQLLAERGIAGVSLLALPLISLLVFYAIALARGVMAFRLPHPAALPGVLSLLVVVLDAFFGVSFLRSDVMVALALVLAVSVKSFPKEKIDG